MPIDQKFPFQAMFHDGTFNNPEYQPGRDVVGCSGTVEFVKIREKYRIKLLEDGMTPDDALAKSDGAKGAIVLMSEQFLVMGMDRGIVLGTPGEVKAAWDIVARNSRTHVGQRVGQGEKKRVEKDRYKPSTHRPEPVARFTGPRLDQVAALADHIEEKVKKERLKV